jgi:hypothetical protein
MIKIITLLIVLSSTALFLNSCSEAVDVENPSLVGKWQSVERQPGGLGTTIIFREDSSVGMDSDIFFTFKYKFDGKNLSTYIKDAITGKTNIETSIVEFEDDKRMILKQVFDGNERTTILTKEGKSSGKSQISGKWSWVNSAGRLSETEFFDDGNASAYILNKSKEGRYRINQDTLSMSFMNSEMKNIIYRVSNDTLYFNFSNDQTEYAYKKRE